MRLTLSFIFLAIFLLVVSCKEEKETTTKINFTRNIAKVGVRKIKKSSFLTSISSNGKLEAQKKAILKFKNEGIIKKIFVQEGQKVLRGKTIAQQEMTNITSEIRKNEELLQKAKLNMEDVLLGFDYTTKDSTKVPVEILKMAKSRSGISEANYQIIQSKKKREESILKAPFSGVVSNLNAQENSLSSNFPEICTLIDDSSLLIKFYILEKEFGLVAKNDTIMLTPIALPNLKVHGTVLSITPVVNENGLILVNGLIDNRSGKLIEGMNANVFIIKTIKNTISIPKNAIVERQGKKVVFIYEGGKSSWKYINTHVENKDSIAVIDGIQVGDRLIVSGHETIAHDEDVELIE